MALGTKRRRETEANADRGHAAQGRGLILRLRHNLIHDTAFEAHDSAKFDRAIQLDAGIIDVNSRDLCSFTVKWKFSCHGRRSARQRAPCLFELWREQRLEGHGQPLWISWPTEPAAQMVRLVESSWRN